MENTTTGGRFDFLHCNAYPLRSLNKEEFPFLCYHCLFLFNCAFFDKIIRKGHTLSNSHCIGGNRWKYAELDGPICYSHR